MNLRILDEFPEAGLLSREQEIACIRGNNPTRLVMHTMREAFVYGGRCCRGIIPENELLSLCYTALQRAIRNYNADSGRFFNYARVFVRGDIAQYWRDKDTVSHASAHRRDDFPTDSEENYNTFPSITNSKNTHTISKHLEELRPLVSTSVDPELDKINLHEQWELIQPLIATRLNQHEQMILDLVYNGCFTFKRIGEMLGVSRSAAQITASRALRKLRNAVNRKAKYGV
jgi:RNA polymerase sigma factor (sigma-70 family)